MSDRSPSLLSALLNGPLAQPRIHHRIVILALLLAAPCLAGRLVLDDHVLMLLARDDPGIEGFRSGPLSLFHFTLGDAATNGALMDEGALLPWWSDPLHLNAFLRPLSSATHLLDFALWPDVPWLMHLHSLLWFAALLGVVAHLYRRFAAPAPLAQAAAMLAFLIFALDEVHGMTIGWVANRNALIAATLSLPALGAHHRWLQDGWTPGRWIGPACFALGLAAGETAVAVLGYFFAHALVLDRAPLTRRALHLLPYLIVLLGWRLVFNGLGLGSAGSGSYHDPGGEPLGYARALVDHLPVLLSAQVGLPMADLWFWGGDDPHLPLWIFSVLTVAAVLALGHLLLSDDRVARFWTLGMGISACAVAASVPGERLLLVPGVGGAMLIAALMVRLSDLPASAPGWLRTLASPLLALMALVHLLLAPASLPVRAYSMEMLGAALERAEEGVSKEPNIAGRHAILLNAPFDVMASYLQVRREARGEPRLATFNWLATASSELRVERRGPSTLRVTPAGGFLHTAPERHYRGDTRALPVGAEVRLSAFTARVMEVTSDGRPAVVDFELAAPLEDPRYLLLRYRDGRFEPLEPPAIGQSLRLPREDFFAAVLSPLL